MKFKIGTSAPTVSYFRFKLCKTKCVFDLKDRRYLKNINKKKFRDFKIKLRIVEGVSQDSSVVSKNGLIVDKTLVEQALKSLKRISKKYDNNRSE